MERIETLVVGGGQAGLAISYCLKALGREHVIVERARVAERWRTERWDSLTFQFPNWSIGLPGSSYKGSDPDGFSHKDAVLGFIEEYAATIRAPLRAETNVTALRYTDSTSAYLAITDRGEIKARNVVIATGPYQRPKIPAVSADFPDDVFQVHARHYRGPAALPDGAVLVVGSGASGCQIADELLQAGRRVYLSVGRHDRLPRRYRGRDVFWWLVELGRYGTALADLSEEIRSARYLFTGVAGGYEVDLRRSASRGMTLLGHLEGAKDGRLRFAPDAEESLRNGDASYREFTRAADELVRTTDIDVTAPPAERASESHEPVPVEREVDVRAERVRSVVWATGYSLDLGWVELPVFDAHREPIHQRGVTTAPGIYFLGLQKLHTLKSSTLLGVGEDAEYIAQHIAERRR